MKHFFFVWCCRPLDSVGPKNSNAVDSRCRAFDCTGDRRRDDGRRGNDVGVRWGAKGACSHGRVARDGRPVSDSNGCSIHSGSSIVIAPAVDSLANYSIGINSKEILLIIVNYYRYYDN